MAIIIGQTKKQLPHYWKATCKGCGCTFMMSAAEIDHEEFNDGQYACTVAKCPQCGNWVKFDRHSPECEPTTDELKLAECSAAPVPDEADILKAFWIFEKYGLIRPDLQLDPTHFINTVVMPNWRDFIIKRKK